jgi:hypothetical protein
MTRPLQLARLKLTAWMGVRHRCNVQHTYFSQDVFIPELNATCTHNIKHNSAVQHAATFDAQTAMLCTRITCWLDWAPTPLPWRMLLGPTPSTHPQSIMSHRTQPGPAGSPLTDHMRSVQRDAAVLGIGIQQCRSHLDCFGASVLIPAALRRDGLDQPANSV